MYDAQCKKRVARCMAACGLALLLSPSANGQSIDLSLNVYYEIPSDSSSGGTWKLVAKSTHSGIASLDVPITGIDAPFVNEAPRGKVNGSDQAGFAFAELLNDSFSIRQEPVFPTGAEEESAFYGVGTVMNGDPDGVGTPYPDGTFTTLQDVPWAIGDDLVAGPSVWDTAATLLSGTFADNAHPVFGSGITGLVFTNVGTSTTYGPASQATINPPIIRTNLVPGTGGPDYNGNGVVDAADYVAWRKLPATFGGDPAGYNAWRANFGETVPGASAQPSGAVPEPASAILLFFALISGLSTLRFRRQSPLAA